MENCIFCQIVNKEKPADVVFESGEVVGFKNLYSEAPIHYLFIPKKHLEWKDEFNDKDLVVLSEIITAAKKVAVKENIFDACKFIFNVGKTGHISHIHLHFLGGWKGEIPMKNI
jgi:histidine triad (HIT) family protein